MAIIRAKHRRQIPRPRPDEEPSAAQVDVFFRVYRETLSEYEARRAQGAHLSRAQLEKLKADPDFAASMDDIFNREDYREQLRAKARKMAMAEHKDLVLAELKAEFPELYGNRTTVQMNLTAEQLEAMSTEQLEALHRKLAGKK